MMSNVEGKTQAGERGRTGRQAGVAFLGRARTIELIPVTLAFTKQGTQYIGSPSTESLQAKLAITSKTPSHGDCSLELLVS